MQLQMAPVMESFSSHPPMHSPNLAVKQTGGRYEVNPGPIIAGSAIGMSGPSPFQRIACETGTYNELNGNREVQVATTAIPIKGGKRRGKRGSKRRGSKRRGSKRHSGKRHSGKRRGSKRRYSGGSALGYAPISAPPTVSAGDAGSMAYYAPTAGYRNDFEALPSGGAVPGLTLQIPYDARAGNPACGMSGGKRRVRFSRYSKKGGKRRSGSKRSKRSKRSCFSLKKLFHL
jgi:hypothetical protein